VERRRVALPNGGLCPFYNWGKAFLIFCHVYWAVGVLRETGAPSVAKRRTGFGFFEPGQLGFSQLAGIMLFGGDKKPIFFIAALVLSLTFHNLSCL